VAADDKPSIVFAHGLWADGSCFGKVVSELQAEGYETIASGYGLDSLDGDVGPDLGGVSPQSVVDLTSKMGPDARLAWTPPPGRWKVLRIGWSLLGTTNHPATKEATGLEIRTEDDHLLFGGGQAILVSGDALVGGSDRRKDGLALGL